MQQPAGQTAAQGNKRLRHKTDWHQIIDRQRDVLSLDSDKGINAGEISSDGMAEPGLTWWVIRMSGVQSPGIIQVSLEKTTTF